MTEQSMKVPVPQAPHPETLADGELAIMNAERTQLIVYCPRNHVGAILHIAAGLWAMYSPLTFAEFCNTLGERGIMLPKGEDLETWLRAVALASKPGDATH